MRFDRTRTFDVRPRVCEAIARRRAIVALETTIMTHGFPRPNGLKVARDCEEIICSEGAVPATVGIVRGRLTVGLDDSELEQLAADDNAQKTNLANISLLLASGGNGSTSVSTTLQAASLAGIDVAATGGIGGVHRDYGEHLDISSDMAALERFPILLVCAGAKSILDIAATREQLETRGIPVVGYRTDCFPHFYSEGIESIGVDARIDEFEVIAHAFQCHRSLEIESGVLVVADPPKAEALPRAQIDELIEGALAEAHARQISGRALTPFVLDRLREMTGDGTLKTNIALIHNNCRIAAQIAVAMQQREIS